MSGNNTKVFSQYNQNNGVFPFAFLSPVRCARAPHTLLCRLLLASGFELAQLWLVRMESQCRATTRRSFHSITKITEFFLLLFCRRFAAHALHIRCSVGFFWLPGLSLRNFGWCGWNHNVGQQHEGLFTV